MIPVRDNILVKPFPSDDISEGGIIVPESAQKISNRVEIIAVGNGTKANPMTLKQGQVAYRVRDWGVEIIIDGQLHFLMNQSAILATA